MVLRVAFDTALVFGFAWLAQIVEPLFRDEISGSAVGLLPYLALACVAAVARTFYDTRSGEVPKLSALLRSLFIAVFVGVVAASILGEYDISPGFKMAGVLVASFFSDSSIGALGRFFKGWLARTQPNGNVNGNGNGETGGSASPKPEVKP